MQIAPLPDDEEKRLTALANFHILDTSREAAFDDIVLIASYICETPIALISLVDRDRQWFKASVGLDAEQTSRDLAFCAHAILGQGVFSVPDATKDIRFADNPLVTGEPDIRFYAGAPLVTSEGYALGTLCVIDTVPKELRPEQQKALAALSRQVMAQMELRIVVEQLSDALTSLKQKEEALKQEKEKAEFLALMRTRFLSNMSHDIRTPLNGIIGYGRILSRLAERSGWDEQSKEFIKRVNEGGAYLLNLINYILELARQESAQDRACWQLVEIRPLCDQVYRLLHALTEEKGIQFKMLVDASVPESIMTDAIKINQVLFNLLGNAIKFTPSGGEVSLKVYKADAKIVFTVKDSGIGISNALQETIFLPFEQADDEVRKTYGGSGLGLAIVKDLVDLMCGEIAVVSEEGKGAEFTVQLPLQ